MKNLRRNAKKNQKGFTLVEIIVVLVILAVLAAASIPTMLGFVEEAKGKAEIANARAAYVACQAIATEEHASTVTTDDTLLTGGTYVIAEYATGDAVTTTNNNKLNRMVGVDLKGASVKPVFNATNTAKIDSIVYISTTTKGTAYQVTVTSGANTVVEKITNA